MKDRQKLLSDEQWGLVGAFLPPPRQRPDRRGRPPSPNRACFEGILWILQTGAAWRFLPDEFPSPSTCWRRLKQWEDEGVWLNAWRALLGGLDQEGLLKWDEAFLDGSFAPAKKGALPSGKPSGARARSGWYWSTVKVFRWEFGWKVPPPVKLSLRKPRWPKSVFRARKAVRAAKTGAGNCRSRLRFRSTAPTTAPPRDRADRPLSREQPPSAVRRQAQAATVQAPLDRGADQCLAGTISSATGSS